MTDLEMTKLAAEAMGYIVEDTLGDLVRARYDYHTFSYLPLHDDSQAMALVKKLYISCWRSGEIALIAGQQNPKPPRWYCTHPSLNQQGPSSQDLNRAIVECVAQSQKREGG